ncbi:MAG: hypothetical protein IPF94_20340 [Betaproteobacteria bacterium]|nr:hypothetical protein [Betaproteobacteria bacterium]
MNNLAKFQKFADELSMLGKWGEFLSDNSDSLSKTKLVAATGIPRSAFYQSGDLVAEVEKIETRLRKAGVLQKRHEGPASKSPQIEVIEMIGELDRLHERLRALEEGKDSLNRRLSAIAEQIEPYKIGARK